MSALQQAQAPVTMGASPKYARKTSMGLGIFQVIGGSVVTVLQIAICATDSGYWYHWSPWEDGRDTGYVVACFIASIIVSETEFMLKSNNLLKLFMT